ncbi:MAG: V-type ATP synthase subunit D [Hydrogenoanaerobacterium sp.]
MQQQIFPTKGNLIASKKTLQLSTMGYDLMDRKRNILIREMMLLIDKSKMLRGSIEQTYEKAYRALEKANMTLGVVEELAMSVPVDDGVKVRFRSVMGVDIPIVDYNDISDVKPQYGLFKTNSEFDNAYSCFHEAKKLTVVLAEVENSVYRLANAIVKTQKRANALKNVTIPRLTETVKFITDSLEEKEREEFSRLKVIKSSKLKAENTKT